jgi:hypothetical protein
MEAPDDTLTTLVTPQQTVTTPLEEAQPSAPDS